MLDWIAPEQSRALSQSEMEHNATLIYNYWKKWSYGARIAILANMEAESTINPTRWQNDKVDYNMGFGLVQWTKATKYFDWAGYDNKDWDYELFRIDYEVEKNIQWATNPKLPPSYPANPPFAFKTFTESELPYRELTTLFLFYYEQPGEAPQYIPLRHKLADKWNAFFKGQPPKPSIPTGKPLSVIYYLKPYAKMLGA